MWGRGRGKGSVGGLGEKAGRGVDNMATAEGGRSRTLR